MWSVLCSSSCCGVIWCFQHLEFWNLNGFFTRNWIICYFSKSCLGIILMSYTPNNISQATISSPFFLESISVTWNKHLCSFLLLRQCLELNRETYSGVRSPHSSRTFFFHLDSAIKFSHHTKLTYCNQLQTLYFRFTIGFTAFDAQYGHYSVKKKFASSPTMSSAC